MVDQNKPDNAALDSHHNPGMLSALIESLHKLFITVSSKLHHRRIAGSSMGEVKGDFDIWDKLGSHVEQMPVADKSAEAPRPKHKKPIPKQDRVVEVPAEMSEALREPGELGDYYADKVASQKHPHMHDQLRGKTMEHINTALCLASEGDKQGAKLHIDLAQSAMHMASRFMDHDEYEAFEAKVERRLQSLVRNDRLDTPDT